jgi:dUTP pyrophosphatase
MLGNYEDITLPKRQTTGSAGYDFYLPYDLVIKRNKTVIVKTGIKAQFEKDIVLMIFIRSSLSINYNLSLVNSVGIIDSDYFNNEKNEGHILAVIKNNGKKIVLKKDSRIIQGIFVPISFEKEDTLNTSKRIGGIGST